jgi:hypothetical protein
MEAKVSTLIHEHTNTIQTGIFTPMAGRLLQRQCACGQHTGGGECAGCREKRERLQRTALSPASLNAVPPIVHDVLKSPGQPLDARARAFMEPRFGHDFSGMQVHTPELNTVPMLMSINQPGDRYEQEADSIAARVMQAKNTYTGQEMVERAQSPYKYDFGQIRIYTDTQAVESARAIHALAYTVGNNIVFGAGQYAPGTDTGKQLLAHELTHTLQQRQHQGANQGLIMRKWDALDPECSSDMPGSWIKLIEVQQETPQSVTIHWDDGREESDICSTGKGHCCVDPAEPDAVACSIAESKHDDTNCTPITERNGFTVHNRERNHRGINWWTVIDESRKIALHEFDPVDNTPLSHGCVRLHEAMARSIFCGVRQHATHVQIHGFARPMCDHEALLDEWFDDFAQAGQPLDGEQVTPKERSAIREERRILQQIFGGNQAELTDMIHDTIHDVGPFALPNDQDRTNLAARIPHCSSTAAPK